MHSQTFDSEYMELRAGEIKLLADAHRQQAELLGVGG